MDKGNFGYNNCLKTAQKALRYLADNERPQGGQSLYNAEHLFQISNEIEKTLQELNTSGDKNDQP